MLGHAVLHHLPDLDRAFAEFHRVLRPGGRIVFAGEPSRVGDRLARDAQARRRSRSRPAWRRALRAGAGSRHRRLPGSADGDGPRARAVVDIHAFAPDDLAAPRPRAPGSPTSRVRGEELTANWFGWFNRALEATADPADVPMLWRQYAFHGYLLLQRLDEQLLEPLLPPAIFYNLLLDVARRADHPARPAVDWTGACPKARRASFRCSRWGSSRCPAS